MVKGRVDRPRYRAWGKETVTVIGLDDEVLFKGLSKDIRRELEGVPDRVRIRGGQHGLKHRGPWAAGGPPQR